jgi:hypothetical protein
MYKALHSMDGTKKKLSINHSITSMTFGCKTGQNQSKLKTVDYGQYDFLHLNISKLFFCIYATN